LLFQLSLRPLPELSEDRRENALQLVKNVLDEHGTAKDALLAITGKRDAQRRSAGVIEQYMGGSMGAAAAQDEALMLLRVELGLGMLY
jgi:hypothetical protein